MVIEISHTQKPVGTTNGWKDTWTDAARFNVSPVFVKVAGIIIYTNKIYR